MFSRQILLPESAYPRIADRLVSLDQPIEALLWSPERLVTPQGEVPDTPAPEAAWIPIDLAFTGQLLEFVEAALAFESMQWIQGCLAGTDGPPFVKIREAGVRLSNSDSPNAGVAEYVMSTVLQTVHGGVARAEAQHRRQWSQAPWREINGTRWLIVGFGSVGTEVAHRARAFGVEVVGLRRTQVADDRADRMATLDQLHQELAHADVVILSCPLTEETRGLADADFFAAMADNAILVNVSRGPVVDHDALVTALDQGQLATAILDVFDVEPLPEDSPLWDHPSIVLTPHVGGAGSGIVPRGDAVFVEQLDNYLHGRPLRLEVR